MRFIEKISHWIDVGLRTLVALFLAVMTVVLAVQIIQRSVFQGGLVWADELARFLMIGIVFFGAAIAIRDKSHITVSIFEDWKPALRKWFGPIQWVAMAIYAVIIVKVGLDTLEIVGPQRSPNMGVSMGLAYSLIPISGIIMILHLVSRIGKKEGGDDK